MTLIRLNSVKFEKKSIAVNYQYCWPGIGSTSRDSPLLVLHHQSGENAFCVVLFLETTIASPCQHHYNRPFCR